MYCTSLGSIIYITFNHLYNIIYEKEGDYYQATWRGNGDTTIRFKYNLWGNDGGRTALALTPYVKLPTSQRGTGNNSIEGGIVVPFGLELPKNFHVGLTARYGQVRNFAQSGYHSEIGSSVAVEHDLLGRDLSGYVEFFSSVSDESGANWIGTLDLGLTYALTRNVQLDAGVSLGVTPCRMLFSTSG